MDTRDLLNLLRHAYLIGHNAGYSYTGKGSPERDKDLLDLISEYNAEGSCTYNDDCGSGNCCEAEGYPPCQ